MKRLPRMQARLLRGSVALQPVTVSAIALRHKIQLFAGVAPITPVNDPALRPTQNGHYWIAVVYSGLSRRDEAFTELEKAYQEHDYLVMPRLKVDPFMDSLRDDLRFKDLLKRMKLPE